jgi:hypothetical protein
MCKQQYHAFWYQPVGMVDRYEAFDAIEPVLKLVHEAEQTKRMYADPDAYGRVGGLRVIYGELLEFEPAEVVKTYRIKREPT